MALEFLLAVPQGSLIGLNFMEVPANFRLFLSGHAAMRRLRIFGQRDKLKADRSKGV